MKEKKKSQKKWLWLLLLLALVVAGTGIYYQYAKSNVSIVAGEFLPDSKDAKKMSAEELALAAQKEVDSSQFTLSIYPEAVFETGTSEGSLYIKNDTSNAYPISVTLKLTESDETIYESGGILPGYEVTQAKLLKNLAKGTYNATAYVDIYDGETKEKKGTTMAEVVVTVNQ